MIWKHTHRLSVYEVHRIHVDDATRLWLVPVRETSGGMARAGYVLRWDTEARCVDEHTGMPRAVEAGLCRYLAELQDGHPDWMRRVA